MNETEPGNFNTLRSDDEVVSRARTIFEDACAHIDARRARDLRVARERALDARPGRRRPAPAWVPLAGGAVACCALAVGAMWMHPTFTGARQQGVAPVPVAGQAADAVALPDMDGNQMDIAQDLDFYRWLASQSGTTPARSRR